MNSQVKQVFLNEGPTAVAVRLLGGGAGLDLTAYESARLELRQRPISQSADTALLTVPGIFVNKQQGQVSFTLSAADTLALGLGRFTAQVVVAKASGDQLKSPLFTVLVKGGTSGA